MTFRSRLPLRETHAYRGTASDRRIQLGPKHRAHKANATTAHLTPRESLRLREKRNPLRSQALRHPDEDIGVRIWDPNGQQCDGKMDAVMNIEPLASRLESFGAAVCEVDGHDVESLAGAADSTRDGKPLVVLARTDPCRDIQILRDRAPKLHYVRFKSDDEFAAYEQVLAEFGTE